MTNRNKPSAGESSANCTGGVTAPLLPASPLTLEAVRGLAERALEADSWSNCLAFIHEQVDLLNRLIERSESEEEAIYEWASGQ